MNNYCSNCGKKIQEGDLFCRNCGAGINQQNFQVNMTNFQQNKTNNNNSLKVTSLVLGLIAIFGAFIFNFLIIPLAITGLVFGIVYSAKEKRFCAGIILNILGIIIPIVIICLLVAMTNSLANNGTFFDESSDAYYKEENNLNQNDNVIDDTVIDDNVTDSTYLAEIQYDEVIKKFENKEDFILLLSQTGCSHCIDYKPKLERVANDYKIDVYYIEVDLIDDIDFDTLRLYINFSGTPTTVFIEDGVEDPESIRITGNTSIEDIITTLEYNGYIQY